MDKKPVVLYKVTVERTFISTSPNPAAGRPSKCDRWDNGEETTWEYSYTRAAELLGDKQVDTVPDVVKEFFGLL